MMYKITDNLATLGIGEKAYPLPHKDRDTGFLQNTDWQIHDVRYLKDEPQPLEDYMTAIGEGLNYLRDGKVVVCCGAGQSRSNAIALGMLVAKGMDYYEAYNLIREKVPIANIEPCHLGAIKQLFDVKLP